MKIKSNIFFYFMLSLVSVWFFILNIYTPLMHDDLAYHFYYDANSAIVRPTSDPITSFWQIFSSMWHHYCSVNGRFTSHFLIQLFCGLLGKNVFNIVNTLVFAIFIYYFTKLVPYKNSTVTLVLLLVSIVFLLPFPGQTMLWLTGSINYLWTATFSLLVIYYLLKSEDKTTKPLFLILLFMWGVFVGWMNESISIGVSGGLFLYMILNRKELGKNKLFLIIGYLIGTALIVFSPGTFARATSGGVNMDYNIIQFFTMRLVVIIQMLIKYPVVLVGLIIIAIQIYRRNVSLLGYVFIFTLLFLYLLGMDAERVFYGISIVSLLLCVIFILEYIMKYERRCMLLNYVSIFLFLICLYPCDSAVASARDYYDYNHMIEADIMSTSSDCVIESRELPKTNKFVYATGISPDRNTVHNRARAFYYHKTSVQSLPPFLYKQFKKESFVDDLEHISITTSDTLQLEAFYSESYPYLIVPMSEEKVYKKYFQCQTFYKPQNDSLKSYQKVVRWLLGSLNNIPQLLECYYVDKEGHYYYILPFNRRISHYVIPINRGEEKYDLLLYLENGNS